MSKLKDILSILFGNLLITSAYAFITVPHEIVNGGVTSFSMVIGNVSGLDIALITNAITIGLLMLCWFGLGKETFFKSILSSICYMGFFSIFHSFNISLPAHDAVCLLIAAVMVGCGYYFCIAANSSTVGFDILALIAHKKDETISIAKVMRLINIVVILMGLFTYGVISILMGIAFALIQTKVLDLLLNMKVNPEKCKKTA